MKRPDRRLFNFAAAVSLAICALMVATWAFSFVGQFYICQTRPAGVFQTQRFLTLGAKLEYFEFKPPTYALPEFEFGFWRKECENSVVDQVGVEPGWRAGGALLRWQVVNRIRVRQIIVPTWMPALLFCWPVPVWLSKRPRSNRAKFSGAREDNEALVAVDIVEPSRFAGVRHASRRLIAVLIGPSIILSAACIGAWAISNWKVFEIRGAMNGKFPEWTFILDDGSIFVRHWSGRSLMNLRWSWRYFNGAPDTTPSLPRLNGYRDLTRIWFSSPDGYAPAVFTFRLPFWVLASLFAVPALLWRRKWTREARSGNYCPACGYDLRATPGRCPECGKMPSLTKGSAT